MQEPWELLTITQPAFYLSQETPELWSLGPKTPSLLSQGLGNEGGAKSVGQRSPHDVRRLCELHVGYHPAPSSTHEADRSALPCQWCWWVQNTFQGNKLNVANAIVFCFIFVSELGVFCTDFVSDKIFIRNEAGWRGSCPGFEQNHLAADLLVVYVDFFFFSFLLY